MTAVLIDNANAIASWFTSGFNGIDFGWKRFLSVLPSHRNLAKASKFVVSRLHSAGNCRRLHFLAPFGSIKEETGVMLDRWTCKRIGENG